MIIFINGLQWREYKKLEWGCVGESACADSWGRALRTGEPSVSLPCFAERRYGGVMEDELLIALTPEDLVVAVEGMEALARNGLRYPIPPYGIQTDARAGSAPATTDQAARPHRSTTQNTQTGDNVALQPTKEGFDLGIVTSNGDEMLEFYRDVLGLEFEATLNMENVGIAQMHRLWADKSLLKLVVPVADVPAGATGGITGATGLRYFTFNVGNFEEVMTACEDAGANIIWRRLEARPGVVVGMVEDPDGNWVEFIDNPPDFRSLDSGCGLRAEAAAEPARICCITPSGGSRSASTSAHDSPPTAGGGTLRSGASHPR